MICNCTVGKIGYNHFGGGVNKTLFPHVIGVYCRSDVSCPRLQRRRAAVFQRLLGTRDDMSPSPTSTTIFAADIPLKLVHTPAVTINASLNADIAERGLRGADATSRQAAPPIYDVSRQAASSSLLCSMCGKRMSSLNSLRRHQERHLGVYPYHCSYCGKGFANKSNLSGHVVRHTLVREHRCGACGCEFVYRLSLQRHVRNMHADSCGS